MKSRRSPEQQRFVDYLLGRIPDDERERMAYRLLEDDEVFEQVAEAEDSLIAGYVRGELSQKEARLVETRLLSTEHGRNRWRAAAALARRERSRGRGWMLAAAAVTVCAIGAGVWLLRDRMAEMQK